MSGCEEWVTEADGLDGPEVWNIVAEHGFSAGQLASVAVDCGRPLVTIMCDRAPDHAKGASVVTGFALTGHAASAVPVAWHRVPASRAKARNRQWKQWRDAVALARYGVPWEQSQGARARVNPLHLARVHALDVPDWEEVTEPVATVKGEPFDSDHLERYRLACPRCRYTVPVRREKLTPILDRLSDAGVSSITLHGLAQVL